jgi:hypothetical protein
VTSFDPGPAPRPPGLVCTLQHVPGYTIRHDHDSTTTRSAGRCTYMPGLTTRLVLRLQALLAPRPRCIDCPRPARRRDSLFCREHYTAARHAAWRDLTTGHEQDHR